MSIQEASAMPKDQVLNTRISVRDLEVLKRAADEGGGRLVVVDAIDHAAAGFYEHFGFRSVPDTMRLFMKVSTIRVSRQT